MTDLIRARILRESRVYEADFVTEDSEGTEHTIHVAGRYCPKDPPHGLLYDGFEDLEFYLGDTALSIVPEEVESKGLAALYQAQAEFINATEEAAIEAAYDEWLFRTGRW